jgi:hypothetical protein
MQPLSMAARHPEQSCAGVLGHVDQASWGAYPAPCTEMVDDGHRLFLCDLRVEQRGAPSLGALLAACPAPQESEAVPAVDFAHPEIVLAGKTKPLAFEMHTR